MPITALAHQCAREPQRSGYRYHVVTHQNTVYRFQVGDPCFVRNRPIDELFYVESRFLHDSGLPHYVLRDPTGDRWRVSQLQMSSKQIKLKK